VVKTFDEIFESFNDLNVLVVGDVMLDSYVWGTVTRISPEAPVPVVNVRKREKRLGGAGNVALNLKALGAKVTLCAVVGEDAQDSGLWQLLKQHNIEGEGIITSAERFTTVKERVLAGSQHIVRVDSEIDTPLNAHDTDRLLEKMNTLIPMADVIVFEDYDKGVITPTLITQIIRQAEKYGIPTVVDPKKRNFLAYQGVTLFKPNLKELREGIKAEITAGSIEELRQAVHQLKEAVNIQMAFITLSENGVYITDFTSEYHLPAHVRKIADVSGAGDTVVSIAALCIVTGLPMQYIAGIANLGGGLVCEHLGVVSVDKAQLLAETKKIYGNTINLLESAHTKF